MQKFEYLLKILEGSRVPSVHLLPEITNFFIIFQRYGTLILLLSRRFEAYGSKKFLTEKEAGDHTW